MIQIMKFGVEESVTLNFFSLSFSLVFMDWTLFVRIDTFELNKPSVVRGHEPYDYRSPCE